MNGEKLLRNTLRVNAAFSLLSGVDFIFFDKSIGRLLSGGEFESLAPTGVSLVLFSVFVFIVSILKKVNKYFVGLVIAMDGLWVIGSAFILAFGYSSFSAIGFFLILLVALIIAAFAYFQTKGLWLHMRQKSA